MPSSAFVPGKYAPFRARHVEFVEVVDALEQQAR